MKAAASRKTDASARQKFVPQESDRKGPCVDVIGAAHDLEADACGRRSARRRRARARETACSLKTTGSRWPTLASGQVDTHSCYCLHRGTRAPNSPVGFSDGLRSSAWDRTSRRGRSPTPACQVSNAQSGACGTTPNAGYRPARSTDLILARARPERSAISRSCASMKWCAGASPSRPPSMERAV